MATQLQLRKGTKIQNDAFTGAEAELTYVTDSKSLRIHDGTTVGGISIPTLVAVQYPDANNNYTWYRKWSDGWVEQGGRIPLSANPVPVNLLITMSDTNYIVNANMVYPTPIGWSQITAQTTSSISIGFYYGGGSASAADSSRSVSWEVKGMAA